MLVAAACGMRMRRDMRRGVRREMKTAAAWLASSNTRTSRKASPSFEIRLSCTPANRRCHCPCASEEVRGYEEKGPFGSTCFRRCSSGAATWTMRHAGRHDRPARTHQQTLVRAAPERSSICRLSYRHSIPPRARGGNSDGCARASWAASTNNADPTWHGDARRMGVGSVALKTELSLPRPKGAVAALIGPTVSCACSRSQRRTASSQGRFR